MRDMVRHNDTIATSTPVLRLVGLLSIALLSGCTDEVVAVSYGAAAITREADGSVRVRSDFVAISTDNQGSVSSIRAEGGKTEPSIHNFRTSSDEPGTVTIWLADDKETVRISPKSTDDAKATFEVIFSDGTKRSVDVAFGKTADVFGERQSLGVRIDLKPPQALPSR